MKTSISAHLKYQYLNALDINLALDISGRFRQQRPCHERLVALYSTETYAWPEPHL